MEEKLEKENVKAMRGSWMSFLVFGCFISSWFTFVYTMDVKGEQIKTNTNLRTIINILNQDSIRNPNLSEENVEKENKRNKLKTK